MKNPLYGAWVDAGEEAGYIKTDDCNGYMQEGFGAMHMTVKDGVRCSTANAYLRPAMERPNLTVITRAMTRQIVLDGKRAVGVSYDHGGQTHTVRCSREVLISAGPIGSPHLLQRSGIGPAAVLNKAGVVVRHDLPGVGENLQDHSEIYIQYACKEPVTLNSKMDPLSKLMIGLRWLVCKDGLGATNHFEAGGFIRSGQGLRWPDIQFHFCRRPCVMTVKSRSRGTASWCSPGRTNPRAVAMFEFARLTLTSIPKLSSTICSVKRTARGSVAVCG